jgi:hypothetical protein
MPNDDIEERLARLGRETEGIRPTAGFSSRVMAALPTEGTSWFDVVNGSSRRFLSIAALTAVAAVAWAVRSEASVDDALAVSYGAMEFDGE